MQYNFFFTNLIRTKFWYSYEHDIYTFDFFKHSFRTNFKCFQYDKTALPKQTTDKKDIRKIKLPIRSTKQFVLETGQWPATSAEVHVTKFKTDKNIDRISFDQLTKELRKPPHFPPLIELDEK